MIKQISVTCAIALLSACSLKIDSEDSKRKQDIRFGLSAFPLKEKVQVVKGFYYGCYGTVTGMTRNYELLVQLSKDCYQKEISLSAEVAPDYLRLITKKEEGKVK